MNRIYFYIIAVAIPLISCSQNKNIDYNVDPDQVLGKHYTAEDFGLWYLLEHDEAQYVQLVNETMKRLPEEKRGTIDNNAGLVMQASDTAEFMQALRESKMPVTSDGRVLTPCWQAWSQSEEALFLFNLRYGDASDKPIIDGTHIKKVSVVESEYYIGNFEVLWQFDMKSADLWQQVTADNIGRRIGMMFGSDLLISAPYIVSEIAGGTCSITGPSEKECYAIATILNGKNK